MHIKLFVAQWLCKPQSCLRKSFIKNLQNQIGQLSKQLAEQSGGKFFASTVDNTKNETCKAVTLRSGRVLSEEDSKKKKEKSEIGGVEKESEVEKEIGGVENMREKEKEKK